MFLAIMAVSAILVLLSLSPFLALLGGIIVGALG